MQLNYPFSGTGNGTAGYLLIPNIGGVPRTGFITVGWASFYITQAGTYQSTFTVSGRVTAPDGSGIYGVKITSGTGTTDTYGNWTNSDLIQGRTYAIRPVLPGYTFVPVSRLVTGAAINLNFTG